MNRHARIQRLLHRENKGMTRGCHEVECFHWWNLLPSKMPCYDRFRYPVPKSLLQEKLCCTGPPFSCRCVSKRLCCCSLDPTRSDSWTVFVYVNGKPKSLLQDLAELEYWEARPHHRAMGRFLSFDLISSEFSLLCPCVASRRFSGWFHPPG